MPGPRLPTSERFWSKVDIKEDDECWYWKASKNPRGYGQFQLGRGKGEGHVLAHRYALLGEAVRDDTIVCHTCDHPACCNPNHLYAGTRFDNAQDKHERNPNARFMNRKLYSGEVWLIKRLSEKGVSQRKIAPMFKVTQSTIKRAINEPDYPTKDFK